MLKYHKLYEKIEIYKYEQLIIIIDIINIKGLYKKTLNLNNNYTIIIIEYNCKKIIE